MDILDMMVSEFSAGGYDRSEMLPGGWHIGVRVGLSSYADFPEDSVIYLGWEQWYHTVGVHEIYNLRLRDLIEEWKEIVIEKVRAHIRETNDRLASELAAVGELEVRLLGLEL